MAAAAVRRATTLRKLGSTNVELPALGLGGAALMFGGRTGSSARVAGDNPTGSPAGFTYPSDADADATLQKCYDEGVRYFDTAPWYGRGQSEHRVGRFLYDVEDRDSFVLSSKVGRLLTRPKNRAYSHQNPRPETAFGPLAGHTNGQMARRHMGLQFDHQFDYTYDGIMRAYEDSLQRLGMNKLDTVIIHDLDCFHFTDAQLTHHQGQLFTSGWQALEHLKGSGEIKAYGAGINHVGNMSLYLDMMELDFFLVSQIYSLLHHGNIDTYGAPTGDVGTGRKYLNDVPAGTLAELDRVQERGMGIVAATVYNSGMLIHGGDVDHPVCNYRSATQGEIERVKKIQAVCAAHGVPLPAAALQFPLAHPVVASMVVGFAQPSEAVAAMDWLDVEIPAQFWTDLREKGLIDPAAPTPE